MNAVHSRWPRSWISRSTIPRSATTPAPPRRSGRAGDFFTSVDVGPLFGELLEVQIAEMASLLQHSEFRVQTSDPNLRTFDLVEAGAGNGRLSADILRAARRRDPDLFNALRLHLVEASAEARRDQTHSMGDVASRLSSSSDALPEAFEGVLIANELLDAFPVHQVVMREDGLREIYVSCQSSVFSHQSDVGRLALHLIEAAPSTPALADYLDRLGVTLEPGWRVEINLRALDWIRDAARRLHPWIHHPDRLRSRSDRALFGDPFVWHADDVCVAPEQRS